MPGKRLSAVFLVLFGVVASMAVRPAASTIAAAQSQPQTAPSPPTADELRRAVANLRGGRIKRPASYR